MSRKAIQLTDELYKYLLSKSLREDKLLRDLRKETAKLPQAGMQISPDEGQFLHLITKILGAKRILEIGTFTGYSSICFASALPKDGVLYACDTSEEWTNIAKKYWKEAGLEQKIRLKIGPASETLKELKEKIDSGKEEQIDIVFIDADKGNYRLYYELSLSILRKGGLILIDNVLWDGKVIDPNHQDNDTIAIRALNDAILGDVRVDLSMLSIADGLTIARKNI
ncbi:SAM-dependent methyltransferase [Leptospira perolatii]|uniref:SAM-dependent methyltransferase n=1 Tax=Leptospira perolatii TaxID=2023191 RepID=A0A2M9ZS59_9LEPT|nr:class I SAM-dependent methyltransferase [Leptospira perolatii]PJZ71372.1 SAM-dependent methyltransferase [Leptospira perolatii]PJZ74906.1 SAM-dependent methyltransferase [Leptospira perolatii]